MASKFPNMSNPKTIPRSLNLQQQEQGLLSALSLSDKESSRGMLSKSFLTDASMGSLLVLVRSWAVPAIYNQNGSDY